MKKLFIPFCVLCIALFSCNNNSQAEKYESQMIHISDSLRNIRTNAFKKRCDDAQKRMMDFINSQLIIGSFKYDTIPIAKIDSIIRQESYFENMINKQSDYFNQKIDFSSQFKGITDNIESELTEELDELTELTLKLQDFSRKINRKNSNDSILLNYQESVHEKSINYRLISLDTTFYKEMYFAYIDFQKGVEIKSDFIEDLNLANSRFKEFSRFNINASEDIYFYNNEFKSGVDFSESNFNGVANFSDCIFYNAYFKNINFKDYVDFDQSLFRGVIDYSGCEFLSRVDFHEININDSTYFNFENTTLPDTIDFSFNGKIVNDIDLSKANFTDSLHYNKYNGKYFKPHYINLYKSDISKFILDYTHFKLIVNDSIENKNQSSSSDERLKFMKISRDEIEGMYEALLNNFKSRGQLESYKLLDIEYQEYKWKNSRFAPLVIFPKYWWNFGYDRERIFYWIAAFLTMFTVITFSSLNYLNSVYPIEKVQIIPLRRDTKKIIERLWFSFIFTSIIFFLLTLKVEKIDYKKFMGTFYIMLMYTIGIVCLAYMANYILQK